LGDVHFWAFASGCSPLGPRSLPPTVVYDLGQYSQGEDALTAEELHQYTQLDWLIEHSPPSQISSCPLGVCRA
jgi:hypothetical protein